jgi:YHS domain-containing protein
MPNSEGFVAGFNEDGSAKVVIQTKQTGCIPGAAHIDLCHCAGCSSVVTIEALNEAGAAVGDLVFVRHAPGVVMKNIINLVGIPLIGLVSGAIAAAILHEKSVLHGSGALIITAAGLLLGILIGTSLYRRLAADNRPIVTHIIDRGLQVHGSVRPFDPVCRAEVNPETAHARLAYQGKNYYFCRTDCMKIFIRNPAKYIDKPLVVR